MRTTPKSPLALALLLGFAVFAATEARADEGMWTFNNFPAAKVGQAYGFTPDPKWLEKVRLASVRLAGGCSASFVSPKGLVQTNHHCARDCIQQLSTAEANFIEDGFFAKEEKDEKRCPQMEVNQLTQITDVTDPIKKATEGKSGADFQAAQKAAEAAILKDCAGGNDKVRCDVVQLYNGGMYNLYKYRRYQDVRLAFAPEESIAFFGGDPDNFEFPRYDLDVAYVRVYGDDGKPLNTRANYFRYADKDAEEGDLTFVSGNPGSTSRLATVAQLELMRDQSLPNQLLYLSEMRGILLQYSAQGEEQKRTARDDLFGIENSYKARYGQFKALVDPALIEGKRKAEAELKAKVDADPAMKKEYGDPWAEIARAVQHLRVIQDRYVTLEGGRGFQSYLWAHAKRLVRFAEESGKPDAQRLREFRDSNLPAFRQITLSDAPVYPELDRAMLRHSLSYLRRVLGPDDPLVRQIFGAKSDEQVADELVRGSKLGDAALRKKLVEGGAAAINASDDPMIRFARAVDPALRAVRKDYEDNVDAVISKNAGYIAQARFKIYGTDVYPDATFSARLSYGAVKGYESKGRKVTPFTTMGGAFERHTGAFPFALPKSWLDAKGAIKLDTKFNFVTTNDIIGGNSGSPVINRNAEVVGLVFDGNIESLGGNFGFDAAVNRTVAVNVGAMKESLARIYKADRIVKELSAK